MNLRSCLIVILLVVLLGGCSRHYVHRSTKGLHLVLSEPGAADVNFSYSLDGYKIHPVVRRSNNQWEIIVPAGNEFKYFYIVDGKVYLPPCKYRENDDFGNQNCIYLPHGS